MKSQSSFFKTAVGKFHFHTNMTRQDYTCMGILMFLFACMVFFRLGSFKAPETTYTTSTGNRDIVLDLGGYKDVQSFSIFLGSLNARHLSLSAYNEVTGAWEVINGEAVVNSVFTWNEVVVNYNLRYLGIVATDDTAMFNELVVKAPDGSIIMPVNSAQYPELFDEQDLFPSVNTYMTGTMFDEVYHGRTAYEFIHGLTTYETTHPHFGKILISLGIRIFGMTPFGWRFMCAVFGTLIIGVMYLFAKRLFNDTFVALATSALLTFDCMHYNLSRIATIDIFAAFFILLMYYFMYEYIVKSKESRELSGDTLTPLALCGISMAFGVATKWTGIYAGIGLGILFIYHTLTHFLPAANRPLSESSSYSTKKQLGQLFLFCCVFFILIPLIVYTLSFIPVVGYSEYKNLIDKAISGSISMFRYHSQLVAEHYYSSPFYEWPIIWMPLLDANDMVNATDVSAISCMGNPAIWWVGIFCEIFVLIRWIVKRDKKAGFLFVSYAAQYVPWMSISRITFIYHYFPSILFVILMMGYTIDCIIRQFKWGKKAVVIYLTTAIIVFFLFFPVISGLPVNKEWGLKLRWLKDWILVL